MIEKFEENLKEASDREIMFFNIIQFLLFLRGCVYLASLFVKFEDRFIIDFTFWVLVVLAVSLPFGFRKDESLRILGIWDVMSGAYYVNLLLVFVACFFLVAKFCTEANKDLEIPIHYLIICVIDVVCFSLLRLNSKEFQKRDKLEKQAPKESDKTNLSYNELNYKDNQCYILSKKVECDILAIFSGLSKEEQDILRPTLKKILDLFYISYDSDNFVITDHELFYSILDFSSDLNEAVRVYKQDKTLSDVSYLKKLEQVSKEFFCNLNEKKQTERKIKLEKTIGKLKIALCRI